MAAGSGMYTSKGFELSCKCSYSIGVGIYSGFNGSPFITSSALKQLLNSTFKFLVRSVPKFIICLLKFIDEV